MSTVAWDGRTLATDRQRTVGWMPVATDKLCESDELVFGFTGSSSEGVVFWRELREYANKYATRSLDEASFAMTFEEDVVHGIMVEKVSGRAYVVAGKRVALFPVTGPFFAVGSGSELAMAAMHLGNTAVQAVHLAAIYDIHTGMGVMSAEVKGAAQAKLAEPGVESGQGAGLGTDRCQWGGVVWARCEGAKGHAGPCTHEPAGPPSPPVPSPEKIAVKIERYPLMSGPPAADPEVTSVLLRRLAEWRAPDGVAVSIECRRMDPDPDKDGVYLLSVDLLACCSEEGVLAAKESLRELVGGVLPRGDHLCGRSYCYDVREDGEILCRYHAVPF